MKARKSLIGAVAVLVAAGTTAMVAAPAGASTNPNGPPTVLSSWGGTARVTPGETLCTTSMYDDPLVPGFVDHPMSVREYTPTVWGLPAAAGAPTQYATFRSRLFDRNTGKVSYGAWAPWQVVTSTRPARWTGATTWESGNAFINVTHQYRGQEDVLWYAGGKYLGGITLQPVYDHNVAFYNGTLVSDVWQTACKDYMS